MREDAPPGSFRHAASGNHYTIAKNGRVSIAKDDTIERQQFDFIIGSGAAGSSLSHLT